MANSSRSALLTRTHKVLKKHYKPVLADEELPVLEQMLYAGCLENARYDAADKAFESLRTSFFDWNEVRVSTVAELAETMKGLPSPSTAASAVKRVLQCVFESRYSFDLEFLRKENLGKSSGYLEGVDGMTPFMVAYVVQSALGGHAIPVDRGSLEALSVLGIVTDENVEQRVAPGMERAIPKNKGMEFGSLLHQLGADFYANCHAPSVQKILLEIVPDAKDRLPKRRSKKKKEAESEVLADVPTKKKRTRPKSAVSKRKSAKKPAAASKKKAAASKTPSKRKPR